MYYKGFTKLDIAELFANDARCKARIKCGVDFWILRSWNTAFWWIL